MRVLVIGGYGNAGSPIVEMLLRATGASVVVAGRDGIRARELIAQLATTEAAASSRLSWAQFDATDDGQLRTQLDAVDLVIVAAGLAPAAADTVRACLDTGTDYIDIQVSGSKVIQIQALDEQARAAGVCVVTDGGFHPGLPAAMIRRVATRVPLRTAQVASVIAIDWAGLGPLADSTVAEMMDEFRDFAYEEYSGGRWRSARSTRAVSFPEPFGDRTCAAMGLAEMHQVTSALPGLSSAGFYVGGFNPVVDRAILPLAWLGMRVAPGASAGPLGRLLQWGLVRFSEPPYGTVLQLDGSVDGEFAPRPLMRVMHPDGYRLTAAPVVATAGQMMAGHRMPGVHLQGMFVEPVRFFTDLANLGVSVEYPT